MEKSQKVMLPCPIRLAKFLLANRADKEFQEIVLGVVATLYEEGVSPILWQSACFRYFEESYGHIRCYEGEGGTGPGAEHYKRMDGGEVARAIFPEGFLDEAEATEVSPVP